MACVAVEWFFVIHALPGEVLTVEVTSELTYLSTVFCTFYTVSEFIELRCIIKIFSIGPATESVPAVACQDWAVFQQSDQRTSSQQKIFPHFGLLGCTCNLNFQISKALSGLLKGGSLNHPFRLLFSLVLPWRWRK